MDKMHFRGNLILPFALLLMAGIPARADSLQYLDHSELALARLYHDISNASESIDLTYLMWKPCSSASKVLMRKLAEKARPVPTAKNPNPRPVKVRMLIDSFFHRNELPEMSAYFLRNGIDFKFFNPTWAPHGGNDHTHSKMTLIDGKVPGKASLITGGRNITDDYFGMGEKNYVDRDVAVVGPSSSEDKGGTIAQAEIGYDKLWAHRLSEKVEPAPPERMGKMNECTQWTPRDESLKRYLDANAAKVVAREKPVSCENVRFTVDSMAQVGITAPRKNQGRNQSTPDLAAEAKLRAAAKPSTVAVLDLVNGARQRLTMENQYFIPDGHYLKDMFRSQKRKGVKLEVFSNMFEKTDEPVVWWHTHYMEKDHGEGQVNHMNFRVAGLLDRWKFTPEKSSYSYHAKTFVADGKHTIVSSFNIDPRSMYINGESALIVKDCPQFAQKVEQMAIMTGRMWTLEEELAVCQGQERPRPQTLDPFSSILQILTKDLQ